MKHRHINTSEFDLVTVASIIERGDIEDWCELFASIKSSPKLRDTVLNFAKQPHHDDSGYALIRLLLENLIESRFKKQC